MLITGHLTLFAITFFYNDPNHPIDIPLRKHTQLSMVNNSSCGSLHFGSYTPWKIGSVDSLETSQKQVFRVKMS
jgi:hypothetical protein